MPHEFSNERERLVFRRKEMLDAGNYTVTDPLIK
jgi:hypothetical protein